MAKNILFRSDLEATSSPASVSQHVLQDTLSPQSLAPEDAGNPPTSSLVAQQGAPSCGRLRAVRTRCCQWARPAQA